MKEQKQTSELDQSCLKKFFVKDGEHQACVLSPFLLATVVDKVTENAKKGWMKEILCADDLVLMGKSMDELRENFD